MYKKTSNPILFTKPRCPNCDRTKMEFKRFNIEWDEIDITIDNDAFKYIVDKGFNAAPVVEFGDLSWCGLRPDKIKELSSLLVVKTS